MKTSFKNADRQAWDREQSRQSNRFADNFQEIDPVDRVEFPEFKGRNNRKIQGNFSKKGKEVERFTEKRHREERKKDNKKKKKHKDRQKSKNKKDRKRARKEKVRD